MIPVLVWCSLLLLGAIYAGYPLWMALLASIRPRPILPARERPPCTVVLACHNEERAIAGKLRQIVEASASFPLEAVLVGCDGCTDGTVEAARSVNDPRIRVRNFPRQGKPATLNALVAEAESPAVVFLDARQDLGPDAIGRLLDALGPGIGVASGLLVFRNNHGEGAEGVDAYWRYEVWIRTMESRSGSVPGATGALYALKRDLFVPIPDDLLLDDVAIPMRASVSGERCVLVQDARIFDRPSASHRREARRKRRTIAGNLQLALRYPHWLLPGGHPLWFRFLGHKLARLLSPFALAGFLVSGGMYAGSHADPGLRGLYLAMLGSLGLSLWKPMGRLPAAGTGFRIVRGFLLLNAVTVLAVWDGIRGLRQTGWATETADTP